MPRFGQPPLCPLEVMMICPPQGSTGLDHAAPKGLFRWAVYYMHLCRAWWFDNEWPTSV